MRSFLTVIFCLFLCLNLSAQVTWENTLYTFPLGGTYSAETAEPDYFPLLRSLEAPSPNGESYKSFLERQKLKSAEQYPRLEAAIQQYKSASAGGTTAPILGSNFAANIFNGIPSDSDLAISNDGKIACVINSKVDVYDAATGMQESTISLGGFTGSLGIVGNRFDPRVTYDPNTDRFIVFLLNGSTSDESLIVVGFSQTNDPSGDWNLYTIPGAPFLLDQTWSDYPQIALTESEVFLTVNLIVDTLGWQDGFTETLIWQIDKEAGYAGDPLNTMMWDNVNLNGENIRYQCPVKQGLEPDTDEIYFVGNRPWRVENDTFFLTKISGNIDSNPTLEINVMTSPAKYGLPPNARQPSAHMFFTNDARSLDACLFEDRIHFVGNTIDLSNGKATIYHGQIDDIDGNRDLNLDILTNDSLEFGYPNIEYSGNGASQEFIISTLHSAIDVNGGTSAIYYGEAVGHSAPTFLKEGQTYINMQAGLNERWGDYSGCQRKYDEIGTVWSCGQYGHMASNGQRRNDIWISEVSNPTGIPVNIDPLDQVAINANVFPNPTIEFVNVSFELERSKKLNISLYNANGKLVKHFMTDRVKSGLNDFSFNINVLQKGVYFLRISDDEETVLNKKLIKID